MFNISVQEKQKISRLGVNRTFLVCCFDYCNITEEQIYICMYVYFKHIPLMAEPVISDLQTGYWINMPMNLSIITYYILFYSVPQ